MSLHNLHKKILDNLSHAVLLLDGGLVVRYLNPAGEVLFGLSERQVQGQRIADLLRGNVTLVEELTRAVSGGSPFTERELELLPRPGLQVTADVTVIPLAEATRDAVLLVEIQQLDRHLRISREEYLLAQQSATRALVRGLAHEVKNPLGGLRGAAQLLERRLDSAELAEYTQVIIGEADRLQALVDRMLGPTALPQSTALNIHEVLERVRQLVAAETGLALETDYDPSLPAVVADRDQLIQVFLNITRNAAQAAGPHGRVLLRSRCLRQFTIGLTRHRLVVAVEVSDDGPGVAPEMLEKIFYPMVSGRDGGSGLGLSIAQDLVQRHGGLIECSSRPGHTLFRTLLPLEGNAHGSA